MKKIFLLLAGLIATGQCFAFRSEIKTATLSDGEQVTARMALPDSGDVRTIVVIVHGSGPNTYLNKRQGFDYFDVLADGFCGQGVGFYTYDRRGCAVGDKPPFYVRIDTVKYRRYTPRQDALDVESHIASIRNDGRFRDCKILLYGISEGTIIAPLVAERGNVPVDGLLLHGYANENMYDIVVWQNEGSNSMIVLNALFDKDGDGAISPQEYGADDLAPYRKQLFQNQPFDSTDVVKNGFLDVEDIKFGRKQIQYHETRMTKIAEGDDEWIEKNYTPGGIIPLTIPWFRAHFALEANKTRLLRLDLLIHIFHGTHDASVSVEGVHDIAECFRVCGKTNLATHVFERHNHDLNFEEWITAKKYSEGMQAIFDTAGEWPVNN